MCEMHVGISVCDLNLHGLPIPAYEKYAKFIKWGLSLSDFSMHSLVFRQGPP